MAFTFRRILLAATLAGAAAGTAAFAAGGDLVVFGGAGYEEPLRHPD